MNCIDGSFRVAANLTETPIVKHTMMGGMAGSIVEPAGTGITDLHERFWVAQAVAGDADAFDRLIEAKGDQLYRRAYAILRDLADAQDATQEALLRAWRE